MEDEMFAPPRPRLHAVHRLFIGIAIVSAIVVIGKILTTGIINGEAMRFNLLDDVEMIGSLVFIFSGGGSLVYQIIFYLEDKHYPVDK